MRSQRAAADGAAAAKQTRASRTCPLSTGPQSERERPKTSPSHWPPINPPIDKYNIIRGCVYQKSRGGESGDFNAGFCSRKEAPTNSSALRHLQLHTTREMCPMGISRDSSAVPSRLIDLKSPALRTGRLFLHLCDFVGVSFFAGAHKAQTLEHKKQQVVDGIIFF